MKNEKLIYWASTGFIAFVMGFSAYNFGFNDEQQLAFQKFGLPNWFRHELMIAKFLGTIAVIFPQVPHKLKEFAYFGFAITIVSADVAHLSSGDPLWYVFAHTFMFGILAISYIYYQKQLKVRKYETTI